MILLAALLLVASAAAHALIGWPLMHAELEETGTPAGLILGLQIGWHYGSGAMLTFGAIAFVAWSRARAVRAAVLAAASALYLGFGAWALLQSAFNPHFFLFLGPGLLFGLGAWGLRRET